MIKNKSENVHISYNQMRMFSRIFWTLLDFVHVLFFRYNLSLILVDNWSLCQKDAVVFFAHFIASSQLVILKPNQQACIT